MATAAVGSGGEAMQRMIRVRQSDQPLVASIWRRDDLRGPVPGPAIIEQADTTTLVEPGWVAEPGENGRLLLRPSAVLAPAVMGGFDPITMEVIRHKLEGIANAILGPSNPPNPNTGHCHCIPSPRVIFVSATPPASTNHSPIRPRPAAFCASSALRSCICVTNP